MAGTVAVQLPADAYDALAVRARARGTTVEHEVVEAVERLLSAAPSAGDGGLAPEWDPEHVNAGWFEMIRASAALADVERPYGPWPPIDSDLAKEMMARDIYRDAFNSEPDW